MSSTIIQNMGTGSTLMMFAAAMMLMFGGLALILSGNRTPHQVVARRVALVPPPRLRSAVAEEARPHQGELLRVSVRGMSEAARREIARWMSKLGVPANRALNYFALARLIPAFVSGIVIFFWSHNFAALQSNRLLPFVVAAAAAIVGWLAPMLVVNYKVKQRTKAVKAGLPDALELLVICVEAGLSLEDGLERVVTELARSQSALADELGLTLADLRILPSRDAALSNFAERVDIPSVRSVVTTLVQALRYGTPLAQSLRVVAAELRNDALISLEERANRLPAFMTLPVILFLMPTIFLMVGGPAVLRLLDAFSR